jgi:hypothetical protein
MIKLISSISYDCSLLQYWVPHYLSFGVQEVLLEVTDNRNGLLKAVETVCNAQSWPVTIVPRPVPARIQPVDYILYLARNKEWLRRSFISEHDWVVPADLDEFIQFPCNLRDLIEFLDRSHCDFLAGTLIDRITSNGDLPPIDFNRPLWDQFPLECNIIGPLASAARSKVVLCRGSCGIGDGHHFMRQGKGTGNLKVHHFKWKQGIIETLIRRRELLQRAGRSRRARKVANILEYYRKHSRFIPEDFLAVPGWSPEPIHKESES